MGPLKNCVWLILATVAALSLPNTSVRAGDPIEYTGAFGTSLGTGDFNRDRIPDLVIGDPEGGDDGNGRVFVVSGKDRTLIRVLNPSHYGTEPSHFGVSLGCGDVNGDRRTDIAVLDQYARFGDGSGTVTVISGKDFKLIKNVNVTAFGLPEAEAITVADLNLDKRADLVAGDDSADVDSNPDDDSHGAIGVVSGKSFKLVRTLDIDDLNIGVFDWSARLASGPSVNGDKNPEVVVGGENEPSYTVSVLSGKTLFKKRGKPHLRTVTISEIVDDPRAELDSIALGKWNRDKPADLFASDADHGPGHDGIVGIISGSDFSRLGTLTAEQAGVEGDFATALSLADFDGDGINELIASDFYVQVSSSHFGRVYVLRQDGTVIVTIDGESLQE